MKDAESFSKVSYELQKQQLYRTDSLMFVFVAGELSIQASYVDIHVVICSFVDLLQILCVEEMSSMEEVS